VDRRIGAIVSSRGLLVFQYGSRGFSSPWRRNGLLPPWGSKDLTKPPSLYITTIITGAFVALWH